MTSTTSSVSSAKQMLGVMRWQLHRSVGITAIYASLLVLAYPLLLLLGLSGRNPAHYETQELLYKSLMQLTQDSITMVTLICAVSGILLFGIVFTVYNFGFIHKKREVDLFHAMPISRTPMFLGRFLAGVICIYVPLVIAFLLESIVCLFFGVLSTEVLVLMLQLLGVLLLMTVVVFAFTVFVAVCSGSLMDTIVSTILISISYPVLIIISTLVMNDTIPGVSMGISPTIATALSPLAAAYIPFVGISSQNSNFVCDWKFYLWWAVLGALLLLAGISVYRRRKSESAESTVAFSPTKMAIRVLSSLAGGMLFGYLIYTMTSRATPYFVGVTAASLLAYLITELLYVKTLRQLKKHILPYVGVLSAFTVFTIIIGFGAFGMDTYIPPKENISNISIWNSGMNFATSTEVEWPQGNKEYKTKQIYSAIQTPETFEKICEANTKFVESARAKRFPYFIGDNRGYYGTEYSIIYRNGAKVLLERDYVPLTTENEEANEIRGEAAQILDNASALPENVMGLFSINALHAAYSVYHIENGTVVPMGEELSVSEITGKETKSDGRIFFEDLPNEKEFRQKLEAALIEDFTAGRGSLKYGEENYYEIVYYVAEPFTARGGIFEGEPAEGKQFKLPPGREYTVSVSHDMTETYALLKSIDK